MTAGPWGTAGALRSVVVTARSIVPADSLPGWGWARTSSYQVSPVTGRGASVYGWAVVAVRHAPSGGALRRRKTRCRARSVSRVLGPGDLGPAPGGVVGRRRTRGNKWLDLIGTNGVDGFAVESAVCLDCPVGQMDAQIVLSGLNSEIHRFWLNGRDVLSGARGSDVDAPEPSFRSAAESRSAFPVCPRVRCSHGTAVYGRAMCGWSLWRWLRRPWWRAARGGEREGRGEGTLRARWLWPCVPSGPPDRQRGVKVRRRSCLPRTGVGCTGE